jgi:hypothetical protein
LGFQFGYGSKRVMQFRNPFEQRWADYNVEVHFHPAANDPSFCRETIYDTHPREFGLEFVFT